MQYHVVLPSLDGNPNNAVYLTLKSADEPEPAFVSRRIDKALMNTRSYDRAEVVSVLQAAGIADSVTDEPEQGKEYACFYRAWNEAAIEGCTFWVMFDNHIYLATNIPFYYVSNIQPNGDNGFVLLDQEMGYTVEAQDFHRFEDGTVAQTADIPVFVLKQFAAPAQQLIRCGFKVEMF